MTSTVGRFVLRIDVDRNGAAVGSLVARLIDEVAYEEPSLRSIEVQGALLKAARPGTLWSVDVVPGSRLQNDRRTSEKTSTYSGAAVPKALGEVQFSGAIRQEFELARASPEPSWTTHERKTAKTTKLPNPGEQRPDSAVLAISRSRRLTTGLRVDLDDADIEAALTGKGLPFKLLAAPDYVALARGWLPSAAWPVEGGRLRAPSESGLRVLEILDLGETPERGLVSGVHILLTPDKPEVIDFEDWRTDEEIFRACESVLGQSIDGALTTEAKIARALSNLDHQGPRGKFEAERLVEAANRTGSLPRPFAEALAIAGGRSDFLVAWAAERREEISRSLDDEFAIKRRSLEASLAERSAELAYVEQRLNEAHLSIASSERASEELRHFLDGSVAERVTAIEKSFDDKIEERASLVEKYLETRLTAVIELADLRHSASGFDAKGSNFASALKDAVDRIVAALDKLGSFEKGYPETKTPNEPRQEEIVRRTTEATASLRRAARRRGIDLDSLVAGAVIGTTGTIPLFFGRSASTAALALARAVGGEAAAVVHCDPTILSAADLLDGRVARSRALLDTIDAARIQKDRWHAAALLDINWAPCGYWLKALSLRNGALPNNLLITASLARDGPRVSVPHSAIVACAAPVEARAAPVAEDEEVDHPGPWSLDVGKVDPAGIPEYAAACAIQFASRSVRNMKRAVHMACLGHLLGEWTPEEASEKLEVASNWIDGTTDDSEEPNGVKSIESYLMRGED